MAHSSGSGGVAVGRRTNAEITSPQRTISGHQTRAWVRAAFPRAARINPYDNAPPWDCWAVSQAASEVSTTASRVPPMTAMRRAAQTVRRTRRARLEAAGALVGPGDDIRGTPLSRPCLGAHGAQAAVAARCTAGERSGVARRGRMPSAALAVDPSVEHRQCTRSLESAATRPGGGDGPVAPGLTFSGRHVIPAGSGEGPPGL